MKVLGVLLEESLSWKEHIKYLVENKLALGSTYRTNLKKLCSQQKHAIQTTSSPAHLFSIRGKRKRGPGTLQTRDQICPNRGHIFSE